MIKPFEFYLENNLGRKEIPNISLVKSLTEKAEIRLARILKTGVSEEKEASIVFEDAYEIVREASQAIMELKGYKPYSHEALISFLKGGSYLDEAMINVLNSYRILMDNSVYRAEKISLEKCKEAIDFAKDALPVIIRVVKNMMIK